MHRFHGRWFRLSVEQFAMLHYVGMAIFKIGVILFNLVPYIALHVGGHYLILDIVHVDIGTACAHDDATSRGMAEKQFTPLIINLACFDPFRPVAAVTGRRVRQYRRPAYCQTARS